MYPFLRLPFHLLRHRKDPPLPLGEVHHSRLICWPWDLDPWRELNNGRTLTLYDLGRMILMQRSGLSGAMGRHGWGAAVAGASVRYRARVKVFDVIDLRSRLVGWDARFVYVEQAMWVRGVCANHALLRLAVTGPGGIVPPAEVARALDLPDRSPPLPGWVRDWCTADAGRPWPPLPA